MNSTNREESLRIKELRRIRLINWHYFANEIINIKGSMLISGENAAGKSTILDAVQYVLTQSRKRFNPAANEKSKRDLKGYVRCKTGEEGNTFLRNGSVISYVALEFYEESKDKTFVLGVKLDSPDPESDIKAKWFCEECSLEALSFISGNKPSTDEQFKRNGQKVGFIQTTRDAQSRFKRRLGNLDNKFYDMIPKALAFKPIDNVKDFITRFILPEREIEVEALRENIRNLREMQLMIETVRKNVRELEEIIKRNELVGEKEGQIRTIDILLKLAEIEKENRELLTLEKRGAKLTQEEALKKEERLSLNEELSREEEKLSALEAAMRSDEGARLIKSLEDGIARIDEKLAAVKADLDELNLQVQYAVKANAALPKERETNSEKIGNLSLDSVTIDEKGETLLKLHEETKAFHKELSERRAKAGIESKEAGDLLQKLALEIKGLKENRISYPENSLRLQAAIREEFSKRGIASPVYIFSELLEIELPEWQDAVEGYLNTQRFSLICEPQYYDIAAEVYNRERAKIHSVLLVNTRALKLGDEPAEGTLATVVKAENRFARAYANYLLGKVELCGSVEELKEHKAAITRTCMLYQSKALRKIDAKIYKLPYIGQSAIQKQLEMKQKEHEELKKRLAELEAEIEDAELRMEAVSGFNYEMTRSLISAPAAAKSFKEQKAKLKAELKEAEKNPTVIELKIKRDASLNMVTELKGRIERLSMDLGRIGSELENLKTGQEEAALRLINLEGEAAELSEGYEPSRQDAERRLKEHLRKKNADTVYSNYLPRRQTLQNQRDAARDELLTLQGRYREGELGTGESAMAGYFDEYTRLTKHDLVQYEEKLAAAKANCELEFRENFLAKMRENIKSAEDIFHELNRSLRGIEYGGDSYRFSIGGNKQKQSLYKMITSDVNLGGDLTLFSSQFEESYQSEMDELFSRLTESDEKGEGILSEYTDYRRYMDYDIEVTSKTGAKQMFSKVYGEKSGGETQTPYYVAIAASFSQVYGSGDSIRLLMMDEAFDKMDDERIASMMNFFKSLNFQLVLATPPAKMEVIGEHVDTILMVYREGALSGVEEFTYEEL